MTIRLPTMNNKHIESLAIKRTIAWTHEQNRKIKPMKYSAVLQELGIYEAK